jgi:multidrug efflux pump
MMVSSLENNIVSGLILIVGVLLFFLGLSNSMFVAISIPASMFLSFIVLNRWAHDEHDRAVQPDPRAGDAGRQRDRGGGEHLPLHGGGLGPDWTAAKKATGEVAHARHRRDGHHAGGVRAAALLAGDRGRVHGLPAQTLIVTLSSSLFVALVIVPTLCAMFMRLEARAAPPLGPRCAGR